MAARASQNDHRGVISRHLGRARARQHDTRRVEELGQAVPCLTRGDVRRRHELDHERRAREMRVAVDTQGKSSRAGADVA